jgi:hypothetical protein
MLNVAMSNLLLSLPDDVEAGLKVQSERTNRPADALALEAIELWLSKQAEQSRHEEISNYAKLHGGTSVDLDPAIESLAIEHCLASR